MVSERNKMQLKDLFIEFPMIETQRLILRQIAPHDAQDLFICMSDPDGMKFLPRPAQASPERTKHYLDGLLELYHERIMLTWGIVLKENSHFIGKLQMEQWSDEHHRTLLGIHMAKQYWGNGYAMEAAHAVIDYLFENTTVNRIEADTLSENTAAAQLCERSGMLFEGIARQQLFTKGAFRDLKRYAILRKDYFQQENNAKRSADQ